MVTVCWSPKGGSGTTVVAASMALELARAHGEAVVVDLDGDVPSVLGLADQGGWGVRSWLAAEHADADGLRRLVQPAAHGLGVVPAGDGHVPPWPRGRVAALAEVLHSWPEPVVVDAGRYSPEWHELLATAPSSLAVLRPCYLALRRAVALPVRPSGVVLVQEPGRSLDRRDIEDVLGVPVVAVVPYDPSVARAVDAGLLLAGRLPRTLTRSVRAAA